MTESTTSSSEAIDDESIGADEVHTGNSPTPPRKSRQKTVLVSVIAAVAALVLGVGGWFTFTGVRAAQELNDAKSAYENAVEILEAAVAAASTASAAATENETSLQRHVDVANQLAALLGDGSDVLKAGIDEAANAQTLLEAEALVAPEKTAGELAENPTVEDCENLREAVEKLTVDWNAFTKDVNARAAALQTQDDALVAAWQLQADTATAAADSIVAANPNAPQEQRDAIVAAAAAIVALEDPLAAEALELWKALQDTSNTAAASEKAYQDQKAAEEAAARNRSNGGSGGRSGGSNGGSNSGGSNSGGGSQNYNAMLEAAIAAEQGIPASSVRCFPGGIGIRCEYPGGWQEFGI